MTNSDFVLVPRIPTDEMISAGTPPGPTEWPPEIVWEEMLSASPSPITLEEIVEVLRMLSGAKLTADVIDVANGWDGPEKQYSRHPYELGARIDTTCGAVYELRDASLAARSLLSRLKGMDNPEGQ